MKIEGWKRGMGEEYIYRKEKEVREIGRQGTWRNGKRTRTFRRRRMRIVVYTMEFQMANSWLQHVRLTGTSCVGASKRRGGRD